MERSCDIATTSWSPRAAQNGRRRSNFKAPSRSQNRNAKRSISDDVRSRFAAQRRQRLVERCDDRAFAAALEKADRRLHLRPHAAGGEMAFLMVAFDFRERHFAEFALLRRAEVNRDTRHRRQNHHLLDTENI